MRICIDPGHGGYDPGACGQNSTQEKDINLVVSLMLAQKLQQQGFEVKLTRDSDDTPWNEDTDLQVRCDIANEWNADLFISIHCNSAANSAAIGTEIWTSRGQTESDILAEYVVEFIKEILPMEVLRVDLSDGDSDKEANYYVLKNTNMPAFLSELAFISNYEEEQLLNDPNFQDNYTDIICKGVCKYFGVGFNNFEKEIDIMVEQWKIDLGTQSVNELVQKEIIKNPEEQIKMLDQPILGWLFFTIINRIAK